MAAMTHLAGSDITIDGRYLRQRCAWCGAVLLDYDLDRVGYTADTPVEERRPGTWPVGSLVRIDGAMSVAVDEEKLPLDSCAQIDPAVTL